MKGGFLMNRLKYDIYSDNVQFVSLYLAGWAVLLTASLFALFIALGSELLFGYQICPGSIMERENPFLFFVVLVVCLTLFITMISLFIPMFAAMYIQEVYKTAKARIEAAGEIEDTINFIFRNLNPFAVFIYHPFVRPFLWLRRKGCRPKRCSAG